ncbi:hypothetical protein FJ943_13675 [Mesorhizobium sp. B2-3-10]|nr:hypothetical protein FJ943_13675 [Mesorhizobium sp. B2-3-10]
MTTDTPLTRYSATNGALVSGFVTAELHHPMGHDPTTRSSFQKSRTRHATIHKPPRCRSGSTAVSASGVTVAPGLSQGSAPTPVYCSHLRVFAWRPDQLGCYPYCWLCPSLCLQYTRRRNACYCSASSSGGTERTCFMGAGRFTARCLA